MPLLATLLLLFPVAAGTHTALRVPVLYRRVELKSREPVMLELDLPSADYQIEPASLGYFADTAPGSPRQFVYSADVPRGLIYAQLPPTASEASAKVAGSVVVLELSAPSGEVFFDDELSTIRANVTELNRRRNMLRLAQTSARGNYRSTLDALYKGLTVNAGGVRAGGWLDTVLAKYPSDVPRIASALADDARSRGEQKGLFYSAEQARLKLLLSQFDLQLGLARVPHERSAELLSLGDEKLVRSTMLGEIEELGKSWAGRASELQNEVNLGAAQLQQLTAATEPEPTTQALTTSMDPRSLVMVPPDTALAGSPVTPRQGLERAMVAAWLSVQQRELSELQTSLPLLDAAREHVAATSAPDWNSRPKVPVSLASFHPPALENLHYYAALDSGVTARTAAGLLGGLAQEFESPSSGTGPGRLADIFDAAQQRNDVLLRLSKASLNVSPDELSYGLLALERCTPSAPEPVETPSTDGPATTVATSFRVAGTGAGAGVVAAPAPRPHTDPEEIGESDLAARAALAGQLDLVLSNPDSRGLAAYDLAYLKFMRWYAGLSLPAQTPVSAGTDKLNTQSYGFTKH